MELSCFLQRLRSAVTHLDLGTKDRGNLRLRAKTARTSHTGTLQTRLPGSASLGPGVLLLLSLPSQGGSCAIEFSPKSRRKLTRDVPSTYNVQDEGVIYFDLFEISLAILLLILISDPHKIRPLAYLGGMKCSVAQYKGKPQVKSVVRLDESSHRALVVRPAGPPSGNA